MEIQSLLLIDEESEAKYTKLPGLSHTAISGRAQVGIQGSPGLFVFWLTLPLLHPPVCPTLSLHATQGREDSR